MKRGQHSLWQKIPWKFTWWCQDVTASCWDVTAASHGSQNLPCPQNLLRAGSLWWRHGCDHLSKSCHWVPHSLHTPISDQPPDFLEATCRIRWMLLYSCPHFTPTLSQVNTHLMKLAVLFLLHSPSQLHRCLSWAAFAPICQIWSDLRILCILLLFTSAFLRFFSSHFSITMQALFLLSFNWYILIVCRDLTPDWHSLSWHLDYTCKSSSG